MIVTDDDRLADLCRSYRNQGRAPHAMRGATGSWLAPERLGYNYRLSEIHSALGLSQSQVLVEDEAYMLGMIPHHSIAIMTSERAHLRDPRVRELAKDIIVAQRREIAEMKYLIADIERNGVRTEQRMPRDLQPAQPAPATENVQ